MTISKPFLAILAAAFAIAFVAMVRFYWRSESLHDQKEALMEEEVWQACERADAERLRRMELEGHPNEAPFRFNPPR